MHDHSCSDGRHRLKLFCGEHRYSNAAVTRRISRHRRRAVNGNPAQIIIRIIENTERASARAVNFAVHLEAARRRDGAPRPAFRSELFAVARRNGKHARNNSALVNYEQDLSLKINLDVRRPAFKRRGAMCAAQGFKLDCRQSPCSLSAFDLLKCDERVARGCIHLAVNRPRPVTERGKQPLGFQYHSRRHDGFRLFRRRAPGCALTVSVCRSDRADCKCRKRGSCDVADRPSSFSLIAFHVYAPARPFTCPEGNDATRKPSFRRSQRGCWPDYVLKMPK